MAQRQIVPSHAKTIDRPLCVVRGAQMWLVCVEADGPDRDKRSIECPGCENR
jgi:transcription initiation factor IIF auxiliary subunit